MKKFGFTLAEVLITLGIIGVVASLTAPALVMSSRNEANAAKLAVIVSNLENAFSNALIQEGVENLFQTRMWTNVNSGSGVDVDNDSAIKQQFLGEIGRYMNVNGAVLNEGMSSTFASYYGGKKIYPMSTSGGSNTASPKEVFPGDGQPFPVIMKNGAGVFIRTYPLDGACGDEETLISQGTNYICNAADVYIDVNGPSAPNTFGRDIFGFQISEKGVLYPQGGLDVAIKDGGGSNNRWDVTGRQYSCVNGDFGSDSGNRGLGCTARLIAEGYKMNY